MKFDPQIHHRRSIRLKGYDYSQSGAYFVTIVAWQRQCLLGDIVNGEMKLNEYGKIVQRAWFDLPKHYTHIQLGTFGIMPNHAHAVIIITMEEAGSDGAGPVGAGPVGAGLRPAPTKREPLSEIVRAFKSFSARRINELRKTQGIPVWQRNYYERIIRDEEEHKRIHLYIEANPVNWMEDDENPANIK